MGVCASTESRRAKLMQKALVRYRSVVDALGLTMGQAKLLYGYFSQIDTTLRGEITLLELWQFLSMDCTGFTERAFSVFDEDGNGTVDFGEFLVSLYNYCTHTSSTLTGFAFDLYDFDASGHIDLDEAVHLLVEIWGQDLLDSDDESIRETVAAFATISYHGRIDRKVFCEFTEKNPTLLMPAYAFQRMLQDRLGGPEFWNRVRQRRYNGNDKGEGGGEDLTSFLAKVVASSLETEEDLARYLRTSLALPRKASKAASHFALHRAAKVMDATERSVAVARRVQEMAKQARTKAEFLALHAKRSSPNGSSSARYQVAGGISGTHSDSKAAPGSTASVAPAPAQPGSGQPGAAWSSSSSFQPLTEPPRQDSAQTTSSRSRSSRARLLKGATTDSIPEGDNESD